MGALQPWHLIILVLVVVLLFGAKRLPDAARSIGKSMKIFKAETKDMRDKSEDESSTEDVEAKQITQAKAEPVATDNGADKQVADLQKQLDDLKKQQSTDSAQKNVG